MSQQSEPYDVIVVGGGSAGVGAAVGASKKRRAYATDRKRRLPRRSVDDAQRADLLRPLHTGPAAAASGLRRRR